VDELNRMVFVVFAGRFLTISSYLVSSQDATRTNFSIHHIFDDLLLSIS